MEGVWKTEGTQQPLLLENRYSQKQQQMQRCSVGFNLSWLASLTSSSPPGCPLCWPTVAQAHHQALGCRPVGVGNHSAPALVQKSPPRCPWRVPLLDAGYSDFTKWLISSSFSDLQLFLQTFTFSAHPIMVKEWFL